MRASVLVLLGSVLVAALTAGNAAAQEVLYTLVSPNSQEEGQFGISVSGAGDVNDDGYADVVVGAPYEDPGSSPEDAGRAYVFSGETGDMLYTLVSPSEQTLGHFGYSVSGAGDVNNDGYPDVVVGASRLNPWDVGPEGEGRAYIFSGPTGDLLHTLVSPNDTTGGFGNSVSGVGDVDTDGYADVIVGAWYEDADSVDGGRAYVFSGQAGDLLHTLTSPNEESEGLFGIIVSGAGDVDSDGYPDVVVGSFDSPGASPERAGRAYVFSGATGTLLHTLVSPHEQLEGWFGVVSGAGYVDDDGCADVIVGALGEGPAPGLQNAGTAYVFSGQTGDTLCTLVSPHLQYEGQFGISVSGVGDVNDDGHADVIVGSLENSGAGADAGRAYVYSLADSITSAPQGGLSTPSSLTLRGPFPNPTPDGEVRLNLQVLAGGSKQAELGLYDPTGRRITTVVSRAVEDGEDLNLTWSPPLKLGPGVYYWRLTAGAESVQRAMVLAK